MSQNKSIVKSSNARVDLCGGTLDLWPLSVLVDGAKTYNCSISCLTEVSFTKCDKLSVRVESPDFKESYYFLNLDELYKFNDPKLSLLQQSLRAFKKSDVIGQWHVKSESPAGSGLGGSSSLLISMLKVLSELSGIKMNKYEMVTWAKNIETRTLKKPAGVQDYYPAVEPGLGQLSFSVSGDEHEVLDKKFLEFLNAHILIVDSQIKHHSGMNNWDIFKKYIEGDRQVGTALKDIAKVSLRFEESINLMNVEAIKELFDMELAARKKVSDLYFTAELGQFCNQFNSIKDILSFKVCGAGGGGCLLILCATGAKESTKEKLTDSGVKVLPFELVS